MERARQAHVLYDRRKMRKFVLYRHRDVSGVSGIGCVAEGVEFSDGIVAIRWLGATPSTVIWESIEHAEKIHGHSGSTTFVFEGDYTEVVNGSGEVVRRYFEGFQNAA